MTNTITYYNPTFYAQEALTILMNALGMASRVHLGYDAERSTFNKGDTISIRKPSTMTAQVAGNSAVDLATSGTTITLDQHYEVRFAVTDKQLAYTSDIIIKEHIAPAAYALANNIDNALNDLYIYCGNYNEQTAAVITVADLTATKEVLFNLGVPMNESALLHCEVDGTNQAGLENIAAFSQWQGAGAVGVAAQQGGMGAMGPKYGFNFFANQNVNTHTAGSLTSTTPITDSELTAGDTSVTVDETTITGDVNAGDIVTFAGNSQVYSITADATAAANSITFSVSPAITATIADGTAVTFRQADAYENLMFHRNFAALAMAKLPDVTPRLGGANVASIQHESGIAIRSLMQYDIANLQSIIVLDILYGVKVLDPNMACRLSRLVTYS